MYYFRRGGYVCIGVCLLVSLFDYAKATQPIFTKIGGKVAHWPRKKPLAFGGKPDHVSLGLSLS